MTMPRNAAMPPTPPWRPQPPEYPWPPEYPGPPDRPPNHPTPAQPTRAWIDPGQWPGRLYDRLLEQRIVMAHGWLDNEAATRLCAQLLTLDAEGTQPIRLELQNLDAELDAALSVMGVLDALRVPVSAYVAGRIRGPAVGLLALADHRYGYPSAVFVLSEPRLQFDGTVAEVTAGNAHARRAGRPARRGHRPRGGTDPLRSRAPTNVDGRRGDRLRPHRRPRRATQAGPDRPAAKTNRLTATFQPRHRLSTTGDPAK
jgi:ATP-dependent Clp protease protease subunit